MRRKTDTRTPDGALVFHLCPTDGKLRIPEDVLPSSSALRILKILCSKQIFFLSDLLFLFSML